MEFDEFTSDEEDDEDLTPNNEMKRLTQKAGVEEMNEVVDLYKQQLNLTKSVNVFEEEKVGMEML